MLPIESVLEHLLHQFTLHQRLVVQAPPGAGKTTRIPIALLQSQSLSGKILLIQPRRLAVYGAARQLASNLNEPVGKTVGYRTRYDRRVSNNTKIEVLTDGLFLNQLQNDPELTDISVVIFDEFHERSTNMDLALAFALESQSALRDSTHPLSLLVMSATLNGAHLSQWLDAPLVASEGRTFPVDIGYHPLARNEYLDKKLTDLVVTALQQEPGNILVFLPGMKQIRQLQRNLTERNLDGNLNIMPLHASLPADQQEQALRPSQPGMRKVVLATNVAETSITIEGIRVVIDSGLVRVSRYDERRGMNHLMTESISAASAEQRSGRAGRTEPGICYRVWGESHQAGLKPFTDPEINISDLAPIALELARWGVSHPGELMLLDQPNEDRFKRAQAFLISLAALNENNSITSFGRQIAKLPLPPRLGALVWRNHSSSFSQDCQFLAALLSEGDPLSSSLDQFQSNLDLRLQLQHHNDAQAKVTTLKRIRKISQQLHATVQSQAGQAQPAANSLAQALAQSFPDRIAQQRQDQTTRYHMSNGKGMQLATNDNLTSQRYLVVLDCDGNPKEPFIRLACAISLDDLRQALPDHIEKTHSIAWNKARARVEVQQLEMLGSLILHKKAAAQPWPQEWQQQVQHQLLEAIKSEQLQSLPWEDHSQQLLQRLQWLHQTRPQHWPDCSLKSLLEQAEIWLQPFLSGCTGLAELKSLNLNDALKNTLSWEQQNQLDSLAPSHWPLPTGRSQSIEYSLQQGPILRARMQEFYGLTNHPTLAGNQPITLELLSPAQRPLQITQDLPNFWHSSYLPIAKEMRGRYPKHFWPENPESAPATAKTKHHVKNSQNE